MPTRVSLRRHRAARRIAAAALVWSLGLAVAAVLVPTQNGETFSSVTGVTLTQLTLVEQHGAWVLLLVLLPVAAAGAVLGATAVAGGRARRAAWAATALVAVEAVAGILSFGAFLVPAAGALALSLWLAGRADGAKATADAGTPAEVA